MTTKKRQQQQQQQQNNNNTERMFRIMNMAIQIRKGIYTLDVLNTDLLDIKLRVTHLSLRYKSKNKQYIYIYIYIY